MVCVAELVAAHDAEGEPEREGRVRIDRVALQLEIGLGDLGVAGVFDPLDLIFVDLPDGSRRRVDAMASLIMGSSDFSIAATPPSASRRRTLTSASLDPATICRAASAGRPPMQDLLEQRIIRHPQLPVSQRLGEPRFLKFGVNRRFGKELQLERLEGRITILLEAVGIRLRLLLREPHERARNREEL